MRVIPVIDLKGGIVVHAVAGDRARYQPVRSVLAPDPLPATIARAFRETGVFDTVYVADLDAISGQQPNSDALQQIADTGLKIWLDAGLSSIDRLRLAVDTPGSGSLFVGNSQPPAKTLTPKNVADPLSFQGKIRSSSERLRLRPVSEFDEVSVPLDSIILGLESLPDETTLRECLQELSPSRCIFSLDLRNGQPITSYAPWQDLSATEIAARVIELGVQRIILLDLATVGTARGPQSLELCRRLQSDYPHLELIGGGGVRSPDDLQPLAQAGFTAALVATALHNGTIRPSDLATNICPPR